MLAPVLAFVCIELGLRLAGYGYDTHYFSQIRIQGTNFLVPNEKFSDQFFPPSMARSLFPVRMQVPKPANCYRIFLFGESAANGDPDPSYGMGRYLEVLLRQRFPGIDFEVVCVAITAIDSNVILPIARDCARRQGDLWLVYMGNNEMVGPFGAETSYGLRAPGLGIIRGILALKRTRTGQLLDALGRRFRRVSSARRTWGGMQMFVNNRLALDDPARLRAYSHFKRNLEDILQQARKAGVPVVLSTVAVNLKDCAPFASVHGPGWDRSREPAWDDAYQGGIQLQEAGHYLEALSRYEAASRLDAQYADLQFRMGSCELALTNVDAARRAFELARDDDALQFRADSRINTIIREAAARHAGQGVVEQDTAGILAAQSPEGIPGLNFFYEHVHLNVAGNYLAALHFGETIRKLLPARITARDKGNWASADLCDCRLALTVWDRQRLWQPIFNRISCPPFTLESNHKAVFKECAQRLEQDKARMAGQSPEQARAMYEQALAWAPGDCLLHGNFEQFLEAAGDIPAAGVEARRLCEMMPEKAALWYSAGKLLARENKPLEAQSYLSHAIALRSDYAEAENELGELLANQGKTAEALAWFKRAIRADPGYPETYLDLGLLDRSQGREDAAMANFQQAANLEPGGPTDYFNRAQLAAASGNIDESIACLVAVVQGRADFWQAHEMLGSQLASTHRAREAEAEFLQAIRYRPDRAQAHLGLGIALAAENQPARAKAEFQAVLKLDPSNLSAKHEMETLQSSGK